MKKIYINVKNGNSRTYFVDDDIKVTLKDGFFVLEGKKGVRYIDSSMINELSVVEVEVSENE